MGLKPREDRLPSFDLGDGVKLRPVRRDDAAAILVLIDANRERLREWLPWVDATRSIEAVAGFVSDSLRQQRLGRAMRYLIEVGDEMAGVVSIEAIDRDHRRAYIGYWIDGACEGLGIMTRAVIALCDHGFGPLGLNRIEIHCGTENWRSRRIPERLGFTNEGIHRQREWLNDHFIDHALYAMLAADWRRR